MVTKKRSQYAAAGTGRVNATPPHVRAILRRTVDAHRVNRSPGVGTMPPMTFRQVHDAPGNNLAGGKANKARWAKGS